MGRYSDQKIDEIIDKAASRVEQRVSDAAERAVGFYYEKTKHDIDLVMEAIDAMKVQVDKIPRIEADVSELRSDMKVVKHAVKATNQDLRKLTDQVGALEVAVYHA